MFQNSSTIKRGASVTASQRPCSRQLPPERPAAAKTRRQTALQQTIAARETCSGRYNLHKWWRRSAPLPLLSPRSPLPHQPSPSSPSILLPISPLLSIPVHPNHHDHSPCYHHPTHPRHDHLLYS